MVFYDAALWHTLQMWVLHLQNVVQKSQSQKKYDNKVASISAPYNISNNNKNLQESNKVPKIDQQLRLE